MSKEKEEIKKGVKAIWKFAQPYKKQFYVLIVLGLISAFANGSIPYITGRFFDALIELSEGETTTTLGTLPLWTSLLLLWAGIQFIANNTDWVIDRMRRVVDRKIQIGIEAEGFKHLFRLPLSYHKDAHINGELQKISTAGWRVSVITYSMAMIAPQLLSVVIGIVLAASINVMLASILVGGVVLYVLLISRILLPVARLDLDFHKTWSEGWNDAAAAVHQIESVKQATAEDYQSKKVREALFGNVYGLVSKLEAIWSNVGFFQRIIVFATQLVVFILSVRLVSVGALTIGELVALNGYALMFFGPFVTLGHQWQTIQNGITAAANVDRMFDEKEEVYTPESAKTPTHFSGEVSFKDVSFVYKKGDKNVLKDVNFDVQAGQVVALVGESGVGKSTAISLISGYNFPTAGNVYIDGVDTREFDLTTLRQHIGVVPQEIALFNDTIGVNIRYGTFDASDNEVVSAAQKAHIHEFVESLPEKYETVVGERGVKLSVGQKQRVAIARAILRDPTILILDEPTSALDAKTEKIVTEALEGLMKGRTTFIIAHRLSTVRKADVIFVFESGQIVERGTHKELIEKDGGVYRHLYEYQVGLH